MAADDVYILALRAQLNGKQVVNTFAMRLKSSIVVTTGFWQTHGTAIKDLLRANQVDDLVYQDFYATQVRGAGTTYNTTPPFRVSTVSYTGTLSGTAAGALTAPPEPGNVAALISLSTSQSGRRRRGRIFLGGISETYVDDDGTLNNTNRATLQTAVNSIVTDYGSGGVSVDLEWGVWSDRIATNTAYSNTWPRVLTSQGAPSPTTAFAAVTAATVRDYVGSQRDRRAGI